MFRFRHVKGPAMHKMFSRFIFSPNNDLDNCTLSHPENDRDVTELAQGYTLQDASFITVVLGARRSIAAEARLPARSVITSRETF